MAKGKLKNIKRSGRGEVHDETIAEICEIKIKGMLQLFVGIYAIHQV